MSAFSFEEMEGHLRAFLRALIQGEHVCRGSIAECEPHNPECMDCGERDCPQREPLHYHHDGCPACCLPEGPP